MDSLAQAQALKKAGRFAEALRVCDAGSARREDREASDVLRVDLLEQVGRYGQARALGHTVLRSKTISLSQRSACEFVLARLDREDGDFQSAVGRLRRSVDLAVQGKDLERACWSQLRLLLVLSEFSGPEAAAAILPDVRARVRTLGIPQLTAAMHIFLGEMEAKRGSAGRGEWHTRLGLQLLAQDPNVWLETNAEITNTALAIMRSDCDSGLIHATRALKLSEQSGRAAARRASLANLGSLSYAAGRFDEAIAFFEQAMAALPSSGDNCNAALDSIARVRLLQDQVGKAGELLERIAGSVRAPSDRRLYVYRHAQLTITHLLARQQRWNDALASANSLIELATDAGDHLLRQLALLTKTELLQEVGNIREAMETLDIVVDTLAQQPPQLYAQYERILACALASEGDRRTATWHFERARRVYEGIRSAPGLLELSRRWNETTNRHGEHRTTRAADLTPVASSGRAVGRNVVQTIAALLRHHSRPELVARELVQLLSDTDSVFTARASSTGSDGLPHMLADARTAEPHAGWIERRLSIGVARDRTVDVDLKVRPDTESQATVNGVRLLLTTLQDLERARAEREKRFSLWADDDEPVAPGHAVVSGHMRKLMADATRVAPMDISVFITGESGTGKEILARAIHRLSARAVKPFIPFNCTAVPRDMLESQLFGHRRGSFTGADRDHAGMIGAARDGTLFLDEIGELGLDLQPKLLRFLESGEICPLGESTPFRVNVRVVAATNSNVEQLVADGRFRDDLFYRLNVIRLRIPPLRERRDEIPALVRHFLAVSAAEFNKGEIRVSEEAMEHLLLCRWPGNVRQLQNEVRRMVVRAERDAVLTPGDLSEEVFNARLAPGPVPHHDLEMVLPLTDKLLPTMAKIERAMIRAALRQHHGNLDAAARALGISRKGLYLKRQRLGL